jgi:cytochrome c peroxidase
MTGIANRLANSHALAAQRTLILVALGLLAGFSLSCSSESGSPTSAGSESASESAAESPDPAAPVALQARVALLYSPLPASAPNPENPSTDAKVDLGRMLYYDARLSKNHDISCNSCHQLDAFGVDGEPTSPGHRGQRGGRNSPTVYNAALHVAQFWDGREPDVEAQAKGPVLNPIEMAAPSQEHVVGVLKSIPGYEPAFAAAFPDSEEPITYDNMARAIGAFERNLMTPGRFDRFLAGESNALDEQELRGLATFLDVGCNTCHTGPAIGGQLYRKLGFIFAYETQDPGLEGLTGLAADRHRFKVPSLRNIAMTGPYFHDGSLTSLEEVVKIMAYHQAGQELDDAQIADVVAFLGSLTGEIDAAYVAAPELPASGPDTPAPDPS